MTLVRLFSNDTCSPRQRCVSSQTIERTLSRVVFLCLIAKIALALLAAVPALFPFSPRLAAVRCLPSRADRQSICLGRVRITFSVSSPNHLIIITLMYIHSIRIDAVYNCIYNANDCVCMLNVCKHMHIIKFTVVRICCPFLISIYGNAYIMTLTSSKRKET